MPAQSAQINSKVREFILNQFPRARQQALQDEDGLIGGHMIDSMGVLELVSFAEQEFGILVEDEELLPENFQSIAALTQFVMKKIEDRPQ